MSHRDPLKGHSSFKRTLVLTAAKVRKVRRLSLAIG